MPPHNDLASSGASAIAHSHHASAAVANLAAGTSVVDLSNLYPAVIECFAIILCGYIAGRSNIISQTEAKGLNTFVSYFSLPALIFMSMAQLDFSSVNWLFLCAICLAKSVVFALVAAITMLVLRPTDYGKSGIYAIFCTQSNDFALGYPILEALYGTTHPDFPRYLYLLAPISLVLLNPIGFVLMEIGKNVRSRQANRNNTSSRNSRINNNDSDSASSNSSNNSNTNLLPSNTTHGNNSNARNINRDSGAVNSTRNNVNSSNDTTNRGSTNISSNNRNNNASDNTENNNSGNERRCFDGLCFAWKIFRGILFNPVVTMTLLGILGNFVFDHKLPPVLDRFLKVLGQAFSASALFSLGVRMVGKVANLRGSALVLPGILISVKTLMLPLLAREFVSLLKPGGSAHNVTTDYSNFGFLYGTFPTAPSVFVFATHYDVQPDLIATSMVAVTFLSAPLMLISAKMVALVHIDPLDYVKELEAFLFHVSIVGLIASMWVVIIFLLSRKWRKMPHCITLCLAVAQCMAATGALLWSVMDCSSEWQLYLQFALVTWGVFAARFFTALLAVTILLLRCRTLAFVMDMRPFLVVIGWCVPGGLVLVLVLIVQRELDLVDKKHDPNFQYGSTQAVIAMLLLWFTLFTTIVCLILQQRQQKRYESYSPLTDAHHSDDLTPLNRPSNTNGAEARSGVLASDVSDLDDVVSTDSDSLFSPNDDLPPSLSQDRVIDRLSNNVQDLPRNEILNNVDTTPSLSNTQTGYRRPSKNYRVNEKENSTLVEMLDDGSNEQIFIGASGSNNTEEAVDGKELNNTENSSDDQLLDTDQVVINGVSHAQDSNDPINNNSTYGTNPQALNHDNKPPESSAIYDAKIQGSVSHDENAQSSIYHDNTNTTAPTYDPTSSGAYNSPNGRSNSYNRNNNNNSSMDRISVHSMLRNRGGGGGGVGGSNSNSLSSRRRRQTPSPESSILRDRDDEFQMLRHIVLLLFLCGSMIVGFCLCVWTLVSEEVSGVYVEMVFLDAVLNYGQGVFTAVIFGLDTKLILLPLLRWYGRVVHGVSTLQLPSLSSVSSDDMNTCEQFRRYHLDKCYKDIVRDRRCRLKRFNGVFAGQELVDWLLLVGLANDRTHAVRYGRSLLTGRVIHHVDDLYHFHDQSFFYAFCIQQPQ